jgi:AcrR family transcriptional regulator
MESTFERTKEAAFYLFASEGYDAATMNQIATAVGVKKPTLYAYFDSKEALFLSVFEERETQYKAYMDQVIDEARELSETEQKLYHIFERYLAYFAANPDLSAFWNRILLFPPTSLKEKLFSRINSLEIAIQSKIRDMIQTGMDRGDLNRGDPSEMLLSIYCIREGLLWAMLLNPQMEERKVKAVWTNLWQGIKNKEG